VTELSLDAPAVAPPVVAEPLPAAAARRLGARWAPLLALGIISLLSLVARAAWIGTPGGLVFDENYYVNAARTIDHLLGAPGTPYFGSQPGLDPNVEHPPLGKLLIAGSIRLFGDRPLGWRMPSLVFGSAAILALYWLVRAAGGSGWLAAGAAAVMAADNLFVVHGRIATLDILVLAFMLAGVALYLQDRWLLAGLVIGLGACTKLVGLYALAVIVLFELQRILLRPPPDDSDPRRPEPRPCDRLAALAGCASVAVASCLAVLYALDARLTTFRNPIQHVRYMVAYASTEPAHPVNPQGLAFARTSSPWQWLVNRQPIVYYRQLAAGGRTLVLVQGRISPVVIFLALPALTAVVVSAWRRRDTVSFLAVAWWFGTFLPFVVVSLHHRFNYLYYMLIVLPGLYVAIARLFSGRSLPRPITYVYGAALVVGLLALYPIRSWGGA